MAESYPEGLGYIREHDWALVADGEATLGITWYAQDTLGEVVHFEPPAAGDEIRAGGVYGEIESVKAVSPINSPVDGEVIAVNEQLSTNLQLLSDDPYQAGWMVKIRVQDGLSTDHLMDRTAYEAQCAQGG